jgi:hypothetical protein
MVTSVVKVQILHLLGKKQTKWKRLKLQLVYKFDPKRNPLNAGFFILTDGKILHQFSREVIELHYLGLLS